MDYIRDRKSNISFSLHDSRILQIEINEDKLFLNMDRIFQYTDNEEKWYKGIIEFTNIDKEECNIMVFNAPCKFRINGAPFSRQRCKRLAPAVCCPFIACL